MAVPKKGPRRRQPELLACFNIMCSNHRHAVGVTARGRLYLPGHTTKELERELLFKDIGGQSCKCADLLQGWRAGNIPFEVPQNFTLERVSGADATAKRARRLQRRAALGRDDARTSLRGAIGEVDKPHEQMAALVEQELLRRKVPVEREAARLRCSDTPKPDRYSIDLYALRFKLHPQGYLTVQVDDLAPLATVPASRFDNPPVRQMADILERKRIVYLLKKCDEQALAQRKAAFREASLGLLKRFGSKNTTVSLAEPSGLFTVTFSFDGLTVQAADRLLGAYEKVRGDLVRIKNANSQRKHHPHRFPPAPGK